MGSKKFSVFTLLAALFGLMLAACTTAYPAARQVADFLQRYTFPGETIAAPPDWLPPGTDRPTLQLPTQDTVAAWETIRQANPDYLVIPQGLLADLLTRDPWFGSHYRRAASFANDRLSPPAILVYTAIPQPADRRTWHEAGTRFRTPDGGELTLLRYRLADRPLVSGEDRHVTLVWQVTRSLPTSPALTLQLSDDGGRIWAQETTLPAALRGETWPTGITMTTHHTLRLPDTSPDGRYTLQLAFTPPAQVLNAPQSVTPLPLHRWEHLPDIRYTPPPEPQHPLSATFGSAIALRGYDAPSRVPVSGTLSLTL